MGLVGSVIVALFLAVSAYAKFTSPKSTLAGLADYGLRGKPASLFAHALPTGELLIALGILTSPWPTLAEIGGMLMISFFTVALVVRLVGGRMGRCLCFGNLFRERISWLTVGRNVTLLGLLGSASWPGLVMHGPTLSILLRPSRAALWAVPTIELIPTGLIALALLLSYVEIVRALGLEDADEIPSATKTTSATLDPRLASPTTGGEI
jgi:hypothetical protein